MEDPGQTAVEAAPRPYEKSGTGVVGATRSVDRSGAEARATG